MDPIPASASFLLLSEHFLHTIQRTSRLEPFDLLFVEGVIQPDFILATVLVFQHAFHWLKIVLIDLLKKKTI